MNVVKVETKQQLDDALQIRMTVFVDEQNVPSEEEIDEYEETATHFVVYNDKEPVGAGRLRFVEEYAKMERICIAKSMRKSGVGRKLMEAMEKTGYEMGAEKSKLNAQTQAVPFYEKLGYEIVSDEFLDAGIPHVTMVKELD